MENKSFTQNTNFGFDNPEGQNLPPKPNNYLPLAIIGTVVGLCSPCCIGLILGIIAIVFSTQVDSKYGYKDYFGAEQSYRIRSFESDIYYNNVCYRQWCRYA